MDLLLATVPPVDDYQLISSNLISSCYSRMRKSYSIFQSEQSSRRDENAYRNVIMQILMHSKALPLRRTSHWLKSNQATRRV